MFVMGNFISSVATLLDYLMTLYTYVIIARALVSWVNPDPYNPIVQFLYKVTEPVLSPIRNLMGSYSHGIDLSPLIVILIIYFLQNFLIKTLFQFSRQFSF
jgi:YggT family protein